MPAACTIEPAENIGYVDELTSFVDQFVSQKDELSETKHHEKRSAMALHEMDRLKIGTSSAPASLYIR